MANKNNNYPKCWNCRTRLKLKGYYGKDRIPRYYCPNDKCRVKTISKLVLQRKLAQEHTATILYSLLTKIIDNEIIKMKLNLGTKIPSYAASKFVSDIVIKNIKYDFAPIHAFATDKASIIDLLRIYDGKLPIVTFIPFASKKEEVCCFLTFSQKYFKGNKSLFVNDRALKAIKNAILKTNNR